MVIQLLFKCLWKFGRKLMLTGARHVDFTKKKNTTRQRIRYKQGMPDVVLKNIEEDLPHESDAN